MSDDRATAAEAQAIDHVQGAVDSLRKSASANSRALSALKEAPDAGALASAAGDVRKAAAHDRRALRAVRQAEAQVEADSLGMRLHIEQSHRPGGHSE